MPELPEVETVCRELSNKITGLYVLNINILNSKLRYDIPNKIESILLNKKIKMVLRRGKNGFIVLDAGYSLHFHLGMTGKFILTDKKYVKSKHDHLKIEFNKKITLIYNDVRKFGYINLLKKPLDIINISQIGTEPFLLNFFKDQLFIKIKKTQRALKEVLLDQSYICGIGNIYASEILFESKISPFKKTKKLKVSEFNKLIDSIVLILDLAIKKGGSSIKNYKKTNQDLGYFQTEFKVYNRDGQFCYDCNNLIIKIKQAGRSSFYCKQCQK